MKKLILVNGDIATGKSHLAQIIKKRFNIPLFTKDEFKESLADTLPFSTYEENHQLSIMAMNILIDKFDELGGSGQDLVLEANFHEEHLRKIEKICAKWGYFVLDLNLYGSPEVLYQRYINRRDNEARHPVHAISKLNDFSSFKEYTLSRQKEPLIGEVININCDDFSYQVDNALFGRIEKFLKMKPILETPRLLLREMTDDDYKSLQMVISDPETMKYYPKPYNEEGVWKWINWCKASYQKRGFGLWAVVLKETGEMIGDCGVSMQTIDDEMKPEIGYHLRKDYHRQGLGKEMTQAVRDYFFKHFEFDEIYSFMNKDNVPSYKTAEANGMIYLHLYKTESGELCRVYRITRSEWEKIYKLV